jgi:hypothetical protein
MTTLATIASKHLAADNVLRNDNTLGVDDVRGSQANAHVLVKNSKLASQVALGVCKHGKWELAEVRMVVAPGQVHVVRVGAGPEHLRVALGKLGILPSELGDLGRANEREVHRPEEDDLPFARV